MIEVEEAQRLLQNEIKAPNRVCKVSLKEALGYVLAEDVTAGFPQPPYPRSPLDGYAVRAEDTKNADREHPVSLKVIGKIYAGEVFEGTVEKGEALRLMTGAPIPTGADTVVRQENTDYGQEVVAVYESLSPYDNYCPVGEDFKKGDVLLTRGTVLKAPQIAILASAGIGQISVYDKPAVAVISTGSEVLEPGRVPEPGKIYDSNRFYLRARLLEKGVDPVLCVQCSDCVDKMIRIIKETAPDVDLILTTGGVSVGEKDIMHEVIEKLGARRLFWRVRIKPGSPTLAAVYEDTLLVCLTGNPYGNIVNFELLVRPVMAILSGNPEWSLRKEKAILQGEYRKTGKMNRFIRGNVQGDKVWICEGNHNSGALLSMRECNCFIEIRPGQTVEYGEEVDIYLMYTKEEEPIL